MYMYCICMFACVSVGNQLSLSTGWTLRTWSRSSLVCHGVLSLPTPSDSLGSFTENKKVQRENACLEISPENLERVLCILEGKN